MTDSSVVNPHFSHRVDTSDPNPIAQAQAAAKAEGRTLRQLNDSNPTHHGLTLEGLPPRYDAQPRGQLTARQALARFLNRRRHNGGFDFAAPQSLLEMPLDELSSNEWPLDSDSDVDGNDADAIAESEAAQVVDPEHLYITSSTSEAYSWLMKLMCDAGEAILCPTPGYPLIPSIAALESVTAIPYPLRFDGVWSIDIAAIEALLEQSAAGDVPPIRAIVLINPNNPTGSYSRSSAAHDDYERVVELARKYGLAIIADEVFYNFALEPLGRPQRIAGERRVLTFGLDGFSKLLAAPHAKVGWIQVSGPQEIVRQALKRLDVIADDYLPMSGIIAQMIPDLLEHVPEQIERIRARVSTNLEQLKVMLATSNQGIVSLLRPEGGWNVILRFPSSLDENELVLKLIGEHGLTAQPGYFFDMVSNGYVCVSLLPEPVEFAANVTSLISTIEGFFAAESAERTAAGMTE